MVGMGVIRKAPGSDLLHILLDAFLY
jgi:hypothetical protein